MNPLAASLLCFFVLPAEAATLNLKAYLLQVQTHNPGIQSARQSSAAAFLRVDEGSSIVQPQLLADATLAKDQKPLSDPTFNYDSVVNHNYSVGVGWQTPFGLQAKLSYGLNYFNFNQVSMLVGATATSIPALSYFEARPALELNQPLWSNGFGRSTRALRDLSQAQALAAAYGSRFQAKVSLVEAEAGYWRLSLAQQAVSVQKDALDRAQKIHDWSAKRVRLHLADEADLLQANALVEVRKLELEAALNEQREASRAFNSARNLDSWSVSESLTDFTPQAAMQAAPPAKRILRDDVKAAEQAQNLAIANGILAEERNTPVLDLFASYSLNSKNEDFSNALSDPFSAHKPTQAIGVKLVFPLNAGGMRDYRRAWAQEQAAAERTYQKRLFDEHSAWQGLNEKFTEAKKRFELVTSLEQAQLAKLTHEKSRLQRGRTVTYQVLLFEQDYLLAQLTRLRSQAEILMLAAQLTLFREE